MNPFWLFTLCVAALVASVISADIICNAGRGLRSIPNSDTDVSCYTPVPRQPPKEWRCPWKQCTQASGHNCEVNLHQWNANTGFTCDKDYILMNGNQIECLVNTDFNKKCPGDPDCQDTTTTDGNWDATCQQTNVHSHCKNCVPFQ
ncbi:uncharacterized protein MELLADRAFT_124115 [Melampsora larici-populina 98AG31]|uniref:Secreted protein n=1 Tax=Melampsora larici-populina (strain 98AG31 / pathotype 3-4-7) TaxID=747676 RepID=F4RCX0_MELLP|nr:uncharacterized protein MELLADRAFT_124115 [Melampsora larici-populina 98AG31]EGG09799.1 secreted protein [Melampsora larici-populina 98AG31]